MNTQTLNTGSHMPMLGLGTWKIDKSQCADVIVAAAKAGYRHFDCACDYGNEKEVGQGLRRIFDEGIATREELWITSKLWNTYHAKEHVRPACEKTLSDLGLDYVDLYLIHFPIALKFVPFEDRYPPEWFNDPAAEKPGMVTEAVPVRETWEAMESLVDAGLAKNIGVCNFGVSLIRDILSYAKISPSVLQVELHPRLTQEKLLRWCAQENIAVTAFSSFGPSSYFQLGMAEQSESLIDHELVQSIAKATGKTPGQVLLRWAVQRGTIVIPKASSEKHLLENAAIFDFDLTKDQMSDLSALNQNRRFNDPGHFCEAAFNTFFPIYEQRTMGGELVQLSLIFLGLAIVIVFAGNFMAKAADVIGEKSGMGASLAGLVLLAAATSLPEFAININAVRLPDSTQGVDLTLGNVLGSSLFNLLILGIVDLIFHSKARMFSSISSAHALSAMVSMALTAIVVLFLLLERDSVGIPLHVWHMGIGTLLCGVFYIFSVRLIYLDQHMASKLKDEKESPEEAPTQQGMSLSLAIGIYLATTVVIFIAAAYLAPTADRIAEITGLGGTFIGSTLLALTTSLPEFVTTIVAVRIGAADMAIGNILGSNTFNIAILLPVDAIYTKGSLLADASPVHAMTGVAVILLTCVATMGILYRAEKKYSIIEPDALLVVLMSLISIWGIYQLTRPTGQPEIKEEPKTEEISYRSPVGCEQRGESHQMRYSPWME